MSVFVTEPYKHQRDAVEKSKAVDDMALFWEMGTGKSKGMIDILRTKYNLNKRVMRTLILGPIAVMFNWRNEFKIHSKINREMILPLDGTGKKRTSKLEDFCFPNGKVADGIVILNYEAVGRSADLFNILLEWQPEILVCDESHLVKNPKADQTKRVTALADRAKHRYILTGTPILNSPIDIFSQYRILDGGETFGKNFFVFRAKYFYDKNQAWAGRPGHFPKFEPRQDLFPELSEKIYSKATRVLKTECLDLPPRVEQTIAVPMTAEQVKVYKQMKDMFIAWFEEESKSKPAAAVATTAMTKALRLMQIASGFVTTEEGDLKEICLTEKEKVTEELLTQLTPEHKVILWCCFKHNYKQLAKICESVGVKYVFITGEQDVREKQASVDAFETDPSVRVVIANRRAGGTGINLIQASYSIIFSRNFSLAEELQSMDRNHRGGSQIHEKITKIDLVTEGTVEVGALDALKNKHDVSKRIIDLVKE